MHHGDRWLCAAHCSVACRPRQLVHQQGGNRRRPPRGGPRDGSLGTSVHAQFTAVNLIELHCPALSRSSDDHGFGPRHACIIPVPQQRFTVGEQLRRIPRLRSAVSLESTRDQVEFLSNWGLRAARGNFDAGVICVSMGTIFSNGGPFPFGSLLVWLNPRALVPVSMARKPHPIDVESRQDQSPILQQRCPLRSELLARDFSSTTLSCHGGAYRDETQR